MIVNHPITPLFNKHSRVLILGSFPSVKSREQMFFYGHPQNRFWKVVAAVFGKEEPQRIDEKRNLAYECGFAMWDVIASCDISASSDSSIKNVTPNDISVILDSADISRIYVNGKTAYKYYKKYLESQTGIKAVCLPSTSPANAAWNTERLIEEWKVISEKNIFT